MRAARPILTLLAALALAASLAAPAEARRQQGDPNGLNLKLMRDGDIDGRRLWIVTDDWLYCYPPTGELILVPRGYVTDFASIPAFARPLIDVIGRNAEAAVAHDWLYAVGQRGGRRKADQIFRYALMEQGVNVAVRNTMYQAVRGGGGAAYGRAGEWDERFGDPERGRLLDAAPYRKRASGVVGVIDGGCARMERWDVVQRLRQTYRSEAWERR